MEVMPEELEEEVQISNEHEHEVFCDVCELWYDLEDRCPLH
jgi:uncharacterized protein YbaR (Trm112 family)